MPVNFFLTSSTPIDLPRFGSEAIAGKRGGDLKMPGQEASGKDAGSFDAALKRARSRPEAHSGPAGARPAAAKAAKPADPPVKSRAEKTKSEPPAEDDERIPEAAADRGSDASSALDAPSTGLGETIPVIALDTTSAARSVVARPAPEEASDGERNAGTLPAGAAEPIPGLSTDIEPAAPGRVLEQSASGLPAPDQGLEVSAPGPSAPAPVTDEAKESTVADGGKVPAHAPAANPPAAAAGTIATGGLVDLPATGATDATDPLRTEKNDLPDPFDGRADRQPDESSQAAEPAASERGGVPLAARTGDLSSVFTASVMGDEGLRTFDHGAEGDPDPHHNQAQAPVGEDAKATGSASAAPAAAGGYQESLGAEAVGSGSDSDVKAAELLPPSLRAVYGEATAPAAAAETGEVHHSGDLRAETLVQIVDKAVFRLREGQSQVRIDLKPESLGHLRLEIATENHLVTLKITAESHVAKDLIDSGLGQLKADLQAQGLKVDELEVSVAAEFNDFNRHPAFSGREARGRRLPSSGRTALQEAAAVTGPARAPTDRIAAGIDCFV